jgi:hypothetical protein
MFTESVPDEKKWQNGLDTVASLLDRAIAEFEARIEFQDDSLEKLLRRFHKAALALSKERRKGKPAFTIEDEYDAQDLLYAILRTTHPDADRETRTRKKASGSKKIDIALPRTRNIIELKFWHGHYTVQDVIGQLQIDIETYHNDPDCGHLYCLIYDPHGNANGHEEAIEQELTGPRTKGDHTFRVTAIVSPRS